MLLGPGIILNLDITKFKSNGSILLKSAVAGGDTADRNRATVNVSRLSLVNIVFFLCANDKLHFA